MGVTWTERFREERSSSQREPTAAWTDAVSCGRARRTWREQAMRRGEEETAEGEEKGASASPSASLFPRVAPAAAAAAAAPSSSCSTPLAPPGNAAVSAASATAASASAGHGRNQSIAHFEKIAGNCDTRAAKRAPTGDRHSRTWSLPRTREVRKARRESGESGWRWRGTAAEAEAEGAGAEVEGPAAARAEASCASRNCGRTSEASASSSSLENIPETSPVPRN